MALSPDYLRTAFEVIGAAPSLCDAAAVLRARDPALRVVLVDALDMRDEIPAQRMGARNVYLASSNGHCWNVTQQPDDAIALILTQD